MDIGAPAQSAAMGSVPAKPSQVVAKSTPEGSAQYRSVGPVLCPSPERATGKEPCIIMPSSGGQETPSLGGQKWMMLWAEGAQESIVAHATALNVSAHRAAGGWWARGLQVSFPLEGGPTHSGGSL